MLETILTRIILINYDLCALNIIAMIQFPFILMYQRLRQNALISAYFNIRYKQWQSTILNNQFFFSHMENSMYIASQLRESFVSVVLKIRE